MGQDVSFFGVGEVEVGGFGGLVEGEVDGFGL